MLRVDEKLALHQKGVNDSKKAGIVGDPKAYASSETEVFFEQLIKNPHAMEDDGVTIRGEIAGLGDYRCSLGDKHQNEDALAMGAYPILPLALDEVERFKQVLEAAESSRATRVTSNHDGSTVAILMFVPIQNEPPLVVGIGAGDSSALLIYRCKGSKNFQIERLTPMHDADNLAEHKWVKEAGGKFSTPLFDSKLRLHGCLAVTRSYGDLIIQSVFPRKDKSQFSKAEIIFRQVPKDAEEVYGMVCSDGVTDALWNDVDIAHCVMLGTEFENISDFIGFMQNQIFRFDNSTVGILKANFAQLEKLVYAGVFDGHGSPTILDATSGVLAETMHDDYLTALSKAFKFDTTKKDTKDVCITPKSFADLLIVSPHLKSYYPKRKMLVSKEKEKNPSAALDEVEKSDFSFAAAASILGAIPAPKIGEVIIENKEQTFQL